LEDCPSIQSANQPIRSFQLPNYPITRLPDSLLEYPITKFIVSENALRQGHYAAKQIFCRDRLIAWSHRRRFETGLELARALRGRRLLDYGCGDGTFLALLWASAEHPPQAVGAELDERQIADCKARLGDREGLSFASIASLDRPAHHERYDLVVCMEVLEHVVDLDGVVDRLWRLLSPDGSLLVSVPVETGLPLLAKQAVRRVAGWRGIGDYPGTSPYSWREYWASVFAGGQPHLHRPVYRGEPPFHDHKGFNWMALRERLARRFSLERVVASPVPWLGPHLATQVWFVARKAVSAATEPIISYNAVDRRPSPLLRQRAR
jgi:SAM-dependent methyltransferase